MKKLLAVVMTLALVGLAACNKKEEPKPEAAKGTHTVKVVDMMDASNYTYMQVSENGNTYWIAAPRMQVTKGETISFSKSLEMKNFHSETLKRTFESILFVEDIGHSVKTPEGMMQHPQVKAPLEQIKIEPLKDGKTIAQIYSDKTSLNGKNVKVRGKVAKFNSHIMDRNWIHIQDGTNYQGGYDLMITSKDEAAVGQTITVEGTVVLDKDFGAGYSYPVMLENAKIKK